ncbi:macro domain-containing protein [Paraburkholderia sp. UCT2]|uniref:macro domain-containing protein n=1 Tax=Paraburkholderia sp. UCT2 TaxID=2615208 RepID=UPI001655166B|nr:macro domain-containing protein [Paraburkholderia sp. UCT2]MBC8733455.1 hypothetical protein [Paraburkholderia sp. UCT2]
MSNKTGRQKCFVVMPFGEKKDANGNSIDFDKIYKYFIKQAIEALDIDCVRCDEIAEAGWIHSKMFQHIYESRVAVVDITSLNPNVFYELGVRHALTQSITVLIRRDGTDIPFNIQGFKVIDYSEDLEKLDEAKKKITDFIKNGLKIRKNDSPVHEALSLNIGAASKELTRTEIYNYGMHRAPGKKIGLITGDIRHIRMIDVWVNSENTNMQMARHHDRSISSVIRYCGAEKKDGKIVADTVANELTQITGENANIPAGEIIVTGAGELTRSHGVKKIFHAAAVVGQPGKGYTPIANIGMCVRNALEKIDSEELRGTQLKSIVFPLMGTGTSRGDLEPKASELIDAAIAHLIAHQECTVERVYFLTRTEQDLEVCQRILQEADEVTIDLES